MKNTLKTFFTIGALFLVLGLLAWYGLTNWQEGNLAGSLTGQNNANQVANSSNQATGPGLPLRLTIPSIGVDAPVIDVGLAADGSVGVPKGPSEVAWYQLGPKPGQQGSAVITGHFGPWKDGSHSVFDKLDQLKPGDKIYVKDDRGVSLVFVVKESRAYNSGETPKEVFNNNDGVYLNLITCNGDWLANQKTYTKRLVVFTEAATP